VLDMLSFYLAPVTDVAEFAAPLEVGAELGARYALVAGDDVDASRLRDNLARFCDLARPFGVTAAVEFAVIRPLATLGQTLRLLADIGRENAVVCLDPLNHIRGGGTVAQLRAADPRLFPYAQISDGVLGPGEPDPRELGRMSPNQRRLPGEGTLPLHEILDALPPGLPLSVELPMPESERQSAREWARATADSTRRFLDAHARR
jgi:sugar phosphate isomerase/epimerase